MQGAVLDRFFGRIHGFPWNDKPVSIHHHSVVGIFIVVVVIVTCTIVAVQMARLIVLVVVWFGNHRVAVTILNWMVDDSSSCAAYSQYSKSNELFANLQKAEEKL